jgi:hypothetical protein
MRIVGNRGLFSVVRNGVCERLMGLLGAIRNRGLPIVIVMRSIAVVVIVVGCGRNAASANNTEWCAPGVPRYAPHAITGETCPSLGRMGDTKLAVPGHYLLGPTGYKGVSIWDESYANRPKPATLDSELTDFAIKIRHTNFKPIETYQDWEDYAKLGKSIRPQPPENRWLHVGFQYDPLFKDKGEAVNMKGQLTARLKDESFGRYTLQKDQSWGLDHYVSAHQPGTAVRGETQREVFYDAKTNATFIGCKSTLRSVPPHDLLTFCRHEFFAHPGDIRIGVSNIWVKTDLARWREVEQGVRAVFQSFVIP